MEGSGWKGKAGAALASIPAQAEFFREMCRGFAAAGRLQLLALGNAERTIAMQCDILAGDGAFRFKVNFDETLGRFSPGIHLEIENIKRFHDGALQWSNSCSARDNETMNRLWTGRRQLQSAVACPRGPAGELAFVKWRSAAPVLRAWKQMRVRKGHQTPTA